MDGEAPPRSPILLPCRDIVVRRSTDTVAVSSPTLKKALSILERDIANPPSTVQLAEMAGVSRATLDRLFLRELRHSYHEEVLRRRVATAKNLLRETDMPVQSIARQCGFCNSGHFVNAFKSTVGATPAAWRRQTCLQA